MLLARLGEAESDLRPVCFVERAIGNTESDTRQRLGPVESIAIAAPSSDRFPSWRGKREVERYYRIWVPWSWREALAEAEGERVEWRRPSPREKKTMQRSSGTGVVLTAAAEAESPSGGGGGGGGGGGTVMELLPLLLFR